MSFEPSLLLSCLQPGDLNERVGFVSREGAIIEVENVCHDPVNGFEIRGEDLVTHGEEASATWHTHPGVDSNLSFGDYRSFLNYPTLTHYIVGTDGVTGYVVENGKVVVV